MTKKQSSVDHHEIKDVDTLRRQVEARDKQVAEALQRVEEHDRQVQAALKQSDEQDKLVEEWRLKLYRHCSSLIDVGPLPAALSERLQRDQAVYDDRGDPLGKRIECLQELIPIDIGWQVYRCDGGTVERAEAALRDALRMLMAAHEGITEVDLEARGHGLEVKQFELLKDKRLAAIQIIDELAPEFPRHPQGKEGLITVAQGMERSRIVDEIARRLVTESDPAWAVKGDTTALCERLRELLPLWTQHPKGRTGRMGSLRLVAMLNVGIGAMALSGRNEFLENNYQILKTDSQKGRGTRRGTMTPVT